MIWRMTAAQTQSSGRPSGVRHVVLGLAVAAYMITYMDRVLIATAVPSIQKEFLISSTTMGLVVSSYRWAYALFQIPGGRFGDKFGPRLAMTAVVVWWSLFTVLTGFSWSATSMAVILFLFGMGEAASFPIATRALSRWTLPAERGFAQGITHAGSRLGGAIAPPAAVYLTLHYGWRVSFYCFGVVGIIWALAWYWYYRNSPAEHQSVNTAELEKIQSSIQVKNTSAAIPWKKILSSGQMWAIIAMYFCYGYNLDFFLTWFPKYLNSARHMTLEKMGIYASISLIAGLAGDVLGGVVSDLWLKRSSNIVRARRAVAMTGFAIAAVAAYPAFAVHDAGTSVLLASILFFGNEITVSISWALALDIGGQIAGSVAGTMNTFGNLGGAISATLVGYLSEHYGWGLPFGMISASSLVALLLWTRIDASRRMAD